MQDSETRTSSFIQGIGVGIFIVWMIIKLSGYKKETIQPQIKICKHLTLRKTLDYIAKYDKFVDSEYIAKKKETKLRYADSVDKYNNILVESDNLIEK